MIFYTAIPMVLNGCGILWGYRANLVYYKFLINNNCALDVILKNKKQKRQWNEYLNKINQ